MAKRVNAAPILQFDLGRYDGPVYQRLYLALREAVLEGRLPPGSRLPSSRALAEELACSRNTVVTAFDQLHAEGYLDRQVGAGSFVSKILPEELLVARPQPSNNARKAVAPRSLSPRGAVLAASRPLAAVAQARHRAFLPGLADPEHFPFDLWSKLLTRTWRRPPPSLFMHGHPAGLPALREALAAHLIRARNLDCTAEQIIITTGAQQALALAAQLLLSPGDEVWIEDPGYPGLRGPLTAAAAVGRPVAVDAEGLSVAAGRLRAPKARMAVVSPSHHYPLSVVMSLSRRLELLDWARQNTAWIIEDDYDSEYRYAGRPLAALQSLDSPQRGGAGRVLYIGSFSKTLFPSLRLGYLVVPADLAERFVAARHALDDHSSAITQPALAAFIGEGHFATHLRRMRKLYGERQAALLRIAGERLADLLEIKPDEAGLHLVAGLGAALTGRMNDQQAVAAAARAGISVDALSRYYLEAPARQGLLMGYAAVPEETMAGACDRLAKSLRESLRS
ncbi:PLP-dependent aminotransferase family protein [Limibacillus sp. MBR-115]|jgi:GntR family transcriptional regulator/MocR family aminotransferase|uniref:MocR-like pyridoxine biosynthesis transcription factor PdxR n=1 Tax=Limibacillus sp. MBR-115 TaxID=3156465 RepID=UPI003393DFBA